MCGFGIPGQGFYSIHIPSDRGTMAKKEVLGILVVESGEANVEIIEKEMRHLFKEVSKWNIKKMSGVNEYMIGFPNEDMRHRCSRFRIFEFETAAIKAKVIPTDISPEADGSLEVVWVKAYNVYADARKEDTVMELAYLVGDPLQVDLKSLDSQGPVRFKVACRDAKEIRGETHVFFNGEGYTIRWDPEIPRDTSEASKVSKFDGQRDKEDCEYEEEESDRDPLSRQATDATKRSGWNTQSGSIKGGGGNFKQAYFGTQQLEAAKEDENLAKQDTLLCDNTVTMGMLKYYSQVLSGSFEGDKLKGQNNVTTDVSVGEEHTHEEGELIDSISGCGGDKEHMQEETKTPTLTQQSSVPDSNAVDMETKGEELVDYDEEPASIEMIEMANLEKCMEERPNKLLEDQAIKIPPLEKCHLN